MANGVISLSKGEKISLSKHPMIDLSKGGNGLHKVVVGLGWDPISAMSSGKSKGLFSGLLGRAGGSSEADIDCDAFAVKCDRNGRPLRNGTIYFGNTGSRRDTVYHTGDNLTGDGDGDDEQIIINLEQMESEVGKIAIGINIYNGKSRGQHFGKLQNAFVRIVDEKTGKELCRFDLSTFESGKTCMFFGELVRVAEDWEFNATGYTVNGNSISDMVNQL